MRTLLAVTVFVLTLAGCSGHPNDREETLDPDRERLAAVHNALCERVIECSNLADDDGKPESLAKAKAFFQAFNKIRAECDRREKADGAKAAGDWLIQQAQKPDDQIIEDWGE